MDTAFPAVDEFGTLIDVLLAGDHAAALAETQRLIQAGHPAEKIVTAGLETAMRRLDETGRRRLEALLANPEAIAPAKEGHVNKRRLKAPRFQR